MPTAVQAPPTSAVEHYQRQQAITAAGLATTKRAFEQGNRPKMLASITLYQYLAARDAIESLNDIVEEQGLDPQPVSRVVAGAFAGIAGSGNPLANVVDAIADLIELARAVTTAIQDAARVSAGVGITARPQVTGYVRMLNPPSCSRCAILAGAFYKWNRGFERHPNCDCRHIPASENTAGDLVTDPEAYFDSLSAAEQNRIFTKSGAQAIRHGADIGQVVSARSGMRTAGGNLRRNRQGQQTTTAGIRRFGRNRLMPEAIYEIAGDDRDQAIALLRQWGYLTS